ncbi:hssA/B-like protein 37 [Drosophila gunungcola]|nr:hssA/B-like protein 37 [Drosophila gunungcola]
MGMGMGMGLGLGLGLSHAPCTGTLTPHHSLATATSPTAHSAPLGNICNTLPHAPSSGLSSNLPLNRNLVMLRNHLRKNTSSSGGLAGNGGGGGGGGGGSGACGVGVQLLQDQDDRLEDQ